MKSISHDSQPQSSTGEPVIARAKRFDHVGLTVPDLDVAVDFFVCCFAARVLFNMDRPEVPCAMGAERLGVAPEAEFALAMLELGSARIELLQWWPLRGDISPPDNDQPGGSHVAIEVDDVAAALQALRVVEGVQVLGEPATFAPGATPGLTNAFVRTPWGALIELVTWHWPDI